jgi:hypothetical protein
VPVVLTPRSELPPHSLPPNIDVTLTPNLQLLSRYPYPSNNQSMIASFRYSDDTLRHLLVVAVVEGVVVAEAAAQAEVEVVEAEMEVEVVMEMMAEMIAEVEVEVEG